MRNDLDPYNIELSCPADQSTTATVHSNDGALPDRHSRGQLQRLVMPPAICLFAYGLTLASLAFLFSKLI